MCIRDSPDRARLAHRTGDGGDSEGISLEHQVSNLAAAEIVLTTAEVEAITALGRADGRLFDADPGSHEES